MRVVERKLLSCFQLEEKWASKASLEWSLELGGKVELSGRRKGRRDGE